MCTVGTNSARSGSSRLEVLVSFILEENAVTLMCSLVSSCLAGVFQRSVSKMVASRVGFLVALGCTERYSSFEWSLLLGCTGGSLVPFESAGLLWTSSTTFLLFSPVTACSIVSKG